MAKTFRNQGSGSTHRWDGALFRAFRGVGMPDLFSPSDEHGIDYYSDHNGARYIPTFAPRREHEPNDQVTIELLIEISPRSYMLRDEFEWLQHVDGVVAEVIRGHAATGRLHINLPVGALRHLAEQSHVDIDYRSGLAWCHPGDVITVRKIAEALASAK